MKIRLRKAKIVGISLYGLSGLLLLYAIWAFTNCYQQIALLAKKGQLTVSGNEYKIVNFYVTNCLVYAVFTAVLFALGWLILHQSQGGQNSVPLDKTEESEKQEVTPTDAEEMELPEEDDFDGWDQKDSE